LWNDLKGLQEAWATASGKDQGNALVLACSQMTAPGVTEWVLTQDLGVVALQDRDTALLNLARRGQRVLLERALDHFGEGLNTADAMVEAVLHQKMDCIAVLMPRTNLDAVLDDILAHHAQAYRLSRMDMAECLDPLAQAWSPAQRQRLDREVGFALLPRTAVAERQAAVLSQATAVPLAPGRRGPRRG
jgi:recombinational DNA repair ATPase RecF